MNTRYFIAIVSIVAAWVAYAADAEQGATEVYFVKDEAMIRIDWASATPEKDSGQLFESFTGTRFYFQVSACCFEQAKSGTRYLVSAFASCDRASCARVVHRAQALQAVAAVPAGSSAH